MCILQDPAWKCGRDAWGSCRTEVLVESVNNEQQVPVLRLRRVRGPSPHRTELVQVRYWRIASKQQGQLRYSRSKKVVEVCVGLGSGRKVGDHVNIGRKCRGSYLS